MEPRASRGLPLSRSAFADRIARGPVVLDGGLATHLEALGYDISGPLWSARVLADAPEGIIRAHRDFIEAGARVVISASYQVSRQGFLTQGRTAASADSALIRSIELARTAVADSGIPEVLVAASVGPYGAITHDGAEYRGRYGLSHAELVDFHAQRLTVLAEANPDVLAIETIPDVDEAAAIVEALADVAHLPAWMTFSCGDAERTWAGQPIEEACSVAMSSPVVEALGVNCVAPELVAPLVSRMAGACSRPLIAYPNSGRVWLPDTETWSAEARPDGDRLDGDRSDGNRSDWPVSDWLAQGVALIGGCCCVEPAEIRALALELTEC